MIIIVVGREGTGKTSQLLNLATVLNPTTWAVLEKKDENDLKEHAENTENFEVDFVRKVYPIGHTDLNGKLDQMKSDSEGTLNAFCEWKDSVISHGSKLNTIVIDGISDLRKFAADKWLLSENKRRRAKKPDSKLLTTIPFKTATGEVNPRGWMEVNQEVSDLLEPLINFAFEYNKNLLMTAQMKEDYIKGDKVGWIYDLKGWMTYDVQAIITLKEDEVDRGFAYSLYCNKAPMWAKSGWVVKNLEREKGLLKALFTHKLLKNVNPGIEEKIIEMITRSNEE